MRKRSVGFMRWARTLARALGAVLLGGLLTAGCGHPDNDGSAAVDTAAVTGSYAPSSEVEALAQPEVSHRHFHFITRRVRHRHAGPR